MKQYLDLVTNVLENGYIKEDRTGVGTISSFGHQLKFDLKEEFPIVKAKFTPFKTMAKELLWFISGNTNIGWLVENNCHIWDEWADKNGDLGPVYGHQWRKWETHTTVRNTENGIECIKSTIDQLQNAITLLKTDPFSRRIIVSAWNVSDLNKMALMPCHNFFQFNVRYKTAKEYGEEYYKKTGTGIRGILSVDQWKAEFNKRGLKTNHKMLSLMWNQRSGDIGLGISFNIASYALLCHMVANVVDMDVDTLTGNIGDAHIYLNHVDGMREMLSREIVTAKATLEIQNKKQSIDDFKIDDFKLLNYAPHDKIDLPIAV